MGAKPSSTAEENDKDNPVKKKKSKKRSADVGDLGNEPPGPPETQSPLDCEGDCRNDFPDEAVMDTAWAGGGAAWQSDARIPLPDFPLPESTLYGGAVGDEAAVDPVCQDVYTCQSTGRPMQAKPDLAPQPSRSEMQDPFFQWRRGGGPERQRVQRQHQHMVDANDPFAAWRPAPPVSFDDYAPRAALRDADMGAAPAIGDGPVTLEELAAVAPPPPLEQLMLGPPPRRENTGQSSGSFRGDGANAQSSASLRGDGRGNQSLGIGTSMRSQQAQGVGSQRPTGMQPPSSGSLSQARRPDSAPISMGAAGNSGSSRALGQNVASSRPGSSGGLGSFPMTTGGSSSRHITQSTAQDIRVAGSLARSQLAQPQPSRPPKTTVRRPSPPPSGSIAVH